MWKKRAANKGCEKNGMQDEKPLTGRRQAIKYRVYKKKGEPQKEAKN